MNKRNVWKVLVIAVICIALPLVAFGHSGGTDSNGGHHDYQNKSGLGSYHYHHGFGPHLHPNGACPYDSSYVGLSTTASKAQSVSSPASNGQQAKPVSQTTNLVKPSFPVVVNGTNLNVTSSNYYPVVINDVTYVPLSSEVIEALNLSGGWVDANTGLVLNSK